MATFNLIDNPWIPVVTTSNESALLSLKTLLSNPQNYLRIESDTPLETVAIYRFVLALLYRALQGPSNTRQAASFWEKGFPIEKIQSYLESYYTRFDIFDDSQPFYQLVDLPLEGYAQNWRKISVAEGPGNTTATFNPVARRGAPGVLMDWITPAQAARKLLEHQTFVLGGLIKKFITSAPGAPSATHAMVMVQGKNLLQTLILQLVKYDYQEDWDAPVWEKPPFQMAWVRQDPVVNIQGFSQLYTWFSRSIRFYPELVEGKWVVRQLAYASGLRPQWAHEEQRDPMVASIIGKKGYYPLGLKSHRALWRDYHVLIPQSRQMEKEAPCVVEHALTVYDAMSLEQNLQYQIFGQYNDQAKVLFWRQENYPLPSALLEGEGASGVIEAVELALESTEKTAKVLALATQQLARHLITQSGREPDLKKDVNPMRDSFPHPHVYWSQLERSFSNWLQKLTPGFDRGECLVAWDEKVLSAGELAWKATLQAVGQNSQSMRAIALAQKTWWAHKKNKGK